MTGPARASGEGGQPARVFTFRGGWHPLTPHAQAAYDDVTVWRGNALYDEGCLCPENGVPFIARGGEYAPGFELTNGAVAQAFSFEPGDRVVRVRTDLPFFLAEWRVERSRP